MSTSGPPIRAEGVEPEFYGGRDGAASPLPQIEAELEDQRTTRIVVQKSELADSEDEPCTTSTTKPDIDGHRPLHDLGPLVGVFGIVLGIEGGPRSTTGRGEKTCSGTLRLGSEDGSCVEDGTYRRYGCPTRRQERRRYPHIVTALPRKQSVCIPCMISRYGWSAILDSMCWSDLPKFVV